MVVLPVAYKHAAHEYTNNSSAIWKAPPSGREDRQPLHHSRLPLHHSRLKAVHFQPLIDKIGKRLAGWWGKHFTRAGKVILCRSVLSSMVLYHLVVFKPPA
jgi:hypothetical protein